MSVKIHLLPECGSFVNIHIPFKLRTGWSVILDQQIPDQKELIRHRAESKDLIHWNIKPDIAAFDTEETALSSGAAGNVAERWSGKVKKICRFADEEKIYEAAISTDVKKEGFRNFISQVFESRAEELIPLETSKHLRVWKREWKNLSLNEEFRKSLRFRICPGEWPDIQIKAGEGKGDDISAEAFELQLKISVGDAHKIELGLCGCQIIWQRESQSLICGKSKMTVPLTDGILKLHVWQDGGIIEILAAGRILIEYVDGRTIKNTKPREGIAGNIDFQVPGREDKALLIQEKTGTASVIYAVVYGLRSTHYPSKYESPEGQEKGRNLYKSKSFTVWETCVEDSCYGEPPAYVLKDGGILSWPRVVEEFIWRNTPWGDMSRQTCRKPYYRPESADVRFPVFRTGIPVLDTAYSIACDIFALCSSEEYTMPGQEGMWSAGLFQGEGESFGVWLRDTVHTAIRCGNLIDREGAALSLRYTAEHGFDNGEDGPAMSAVGIWDHYCATHDVTLIYETWPALCKRIELAEERYHADRGLVYAIKSTSNDAFDEPEAGGYCLGTEIYYMEAFLCMEKMGKLIGENSKRVKRFGEIGRGIRKRIHEEYWNEKAGYFAGGPKGSDSYENNYWETSGEEAAVWSKFGIADDRQKSMILERLEKTAMTEFGIDLFPYRREKNHLCHSSWGVWNAGFASAACETGNNELVWKLLMQQVRNVIFNKTFYEVIDLDSGRAWRWPGQLWHAAGFISTIFYGLLGITYDEYGMYVNPIKQNYTQKMQLEGLRFGEGTYDIIFCKDGTRLYLDGHPVRFISAVLKGRHKVELRKEEI